MDDFRVAYFQGAYNFDNQGEKGIATRIFKGKFNSNLNIF
jgi:hypothetical protein